jgi:hypothetical protein
MFGPLGQRPDGTVVFATPIGKGHVPMIALKDLGWWARYTFDHRAESSTKDFEIASDWVGWDYLRETFETVTGNKAIVVYQTVDEWFGNFVGILDEVRIRLIYLLFLARTRRILILGPSLSPLIFVAKALMASPPGAKTLARSGVNGGMT